MGGSFPPPRKVDQSQELVSGRELQAARLVSLISRAARGHEDAFAELYDQTSTGSTA